MRNAWTRVGAVIGLVGALGLTACQAEVDTNPDEGGVRVDMEASEGVDDEGTE